MNLENLEDLYELSPVQQGLLFHSLAAPNSGMYVVQISCTFEGPLDVEAFERAWQKVVDSETALRTSFMWEDLDKPVQLVERHVSMPIRHYDWRHLSPAEQKAHLQSFVVTDREQGFALTEAPLMRLALFRLNESAYRFLWSHHHLLLDGWSVALVIQKVLKQYKAFCQKQELPLHRGRPYKEHIAWLQRQDLTHSEKYWQHTLEGFTPLTLHINGQDTSSANEQVRDGEEVLRLSASATAALLALSRKYHVTMNSLLMGAWVLLLSRYSGEEDIVFGTTFAGRPETVPETESMVGMFINTLPVRVQVKPYMPYIPWVKELQDQQIDTRQYEQSSLTQIRRWGNIPQHIPLFETIFIFENYPLASLLKHIDLNVSIYDICSTAKTHYPLCLLARLETELVVWLQYEPDRFDARAIKQMLGHLQTILESVAAKPLEYIANIALLTEAERHQQLVIWNTPPDYQAGACSICEIFEAQVAKTPEANAVCYGSLKLSYKELNRRANQLAHHLRSLGAGSEVLVGLYMERSLAMVIGLLGILKAGSAYVPLDPTYPYERLAYMLHDAQVTILVTQEAFKQHFSGQVTSVVCLDAGDGLSMKGNAENPVCTMNATSLAYVMYTSGSTGKPKGTMISHEGLINYLLWCVQAYEVARGEGAPVHSSISFDLTVTSLFAPLLTGRTVYLLPERLYLDSLLASLDEKVTFSFVKITPGHLLFLHQQALSQKEKLSARGLIIGGENLLAEDIAFLQQEDRPPCVFNEYGPTETVVGACVYQTRPGEQQAGPVPIGRPIANTEVYLLDKHLQLLPPGAPGEIYIGGKGVARGYLNQPALTAEKFIPHPFSLKPGARLYKTGDVARYLPDGNIVFLGRADQQVKIRGFRVELAEIEAVLRQHPGVEECFILAQDTTSLMAYIVAEQASTTFDFSEIRSFVQEKLPPYMVPAVFVTLERLPRTTNGKVDRQALLELIPAYQPNQERTVVAPRTIIEEVVADIWMQVLNLKEISIDDNFFAIGGHSLLALQIITRVRKAFQVQLVLSEFLGCVTVAKLSDFLVAHEARAGQTEKIAQVLKRIRSMSDEEREAILQKKRREKGKR